MSVAIITGSAGLVGSESCRFFAEKGLDIIGVDNDMRSVFFGDAASTSWQRQQLESELGARYKHKDIDIRDNSAVSELFLRYGRDIQLVIHAAAQPSHDWAAQDPLTDFSVNANGTLNLLEATRQYAPDAAFVFTSTNKVYGDTPNSLPLIELDTRYEIDEEHQYQNGIDECMSIDHCLHSLFGVSKAAADLAVQEYGQYFGLRTASFRGGCLTGPNHSGTQLHGFLAYLMKCVVTGTPYTVFGYKGKQVRDNIHSLDLIRAFDAFFDDPESGEVYNIGGGRFSNCSMLEAIALCEQISGKELDFTISEEARSGDHIWYISDLSRFKRRYPEWQPQYDVTAILTEIYDRNVERWLGNTQG